MDNLGERKEYVSQDEPNSKQLAIVASGRVLVQERHFLFASGSLTLIHSFFFAVISAQKQKIAVCQ